MQLGNPHNILKEYGQVAVQSEADYADPHRLIQMLMEGALDKISTAKGHIERSEHQMKGEQLGMAVSIVNGLRSSLDMEKGGPIAENLDNLYDYMVRKLFEANMKNDLEILDEVLGLVHQIKSGWDAIADQVK